MLAILLVYLLALALIVFLVLQVIPPIVHEIEQAWRTSSRATFMTSRHWANNNEQFQDLNAKYHITAKLSQEAATAPLPSVQRREHPRVVHRQHPRAPARRRSPCSR